MLPAIDLFGVTIAEPMTTVTDYLIAATAWWLGVRLLTLADRGFALRLWVAGFAFIGLAAFLGGTSHGFSQYLGESQVDTLWMATVYSVGLSMLFAVAGTLEGSPLPAFVRRLLHAINLFGFAVYAWWMLSHTAFVYVIYHYVPAMTGIALVQGWAWLRFGARSAPWMISGVVVTLLGAVIQQSGLAIHRHFNHNDLYHLIQVAGLYLLYRGVAVLPRSA
jgi:hypothetical protein